MSRVVAVAWLAGGLIGSAVAGELHDAVENGDLAAVKVSLADGADVDERGPNAETALIAAGSPRSPRKMISTAPFGPMTATSAVGQA